MDSVREIAILFSVSSVVFGAVGILGHERLRGSLKYITAVCFLALIVSGIVSADWNFEKPQTASAEVRDNTEIKLYEYNAEYALGELLHENGIEFNKISASATKNSDGSIIIYEVLIYGATDIKKAGEVFIKNGIDLRVEFK